MLVFRGVSDIFATLIMYIYIYIYTSQTRDETRIRKPNKRLLNGCDVYNSSFHGETFRVWVILVANVSENE